MTVCDHVTEAACRPDYNVFILIKRELSLCRDADGGSFFVP